MGIRIFIKVAATAAAFSFFNLTAIHADELCAGLQDPDFFRERALQPENRIAFVNPSGGALGLPTGLCWWHSRLQRSFIYLAQTRPLAQGEKPMSQSEIGNAVVKLIVENSVVTLRGYKNIFEFTQTNKDLIHHKMQWWQALEATQAVRGLKGKPVVSATKMQSLMTKLYDYVEKNKLIAYEMLQFPGVAAHAWLVTHMRPIYEGLLHVGYELSIIDSNFPGQSRLFNYRFGQTHFVGDFGDFTPYLQWKSSLNRYAEALRHHCKPSLNEPSNDYEIDNTLARQEESDLYPSATASAFQ
jgi:hypothetical protein